MMEIVKIDVDLISMAPIMFGAPFRTQKNEGESFDAYEERCWRERLHINSDGHVFIPPLAIKNCLSEAAKYASVQIPGKGKSTYTKHVEAGLLVTDELVLSNGNGKPVVGAEVDPLRLHVPSDGKRKPGPRVWKNFPLVSQWTAHAVIYLLDEVLQQKPEIIDRFLVVGGKFIGLGAMRVRNLGITGRFRHENFKVTVESL